VSCTPPFPLCSFVRVESACLEKSTTWIRAYVLLLRVFVALSVSYLFSLFRIATTITYPIQVIKSRLQQRSQSIELTACGNARVVHREYRGVIDVVTRVRQKEGPFGFFKGCVPNAIRVAPGSAITFFVYETVMDALS